jgi:hypothetical protein
MTVTWQGAVTSDRGDSPSGKRNVRPIWAGGVVLESNFPPGVPAKSGIAARTPQTCRKTPRDSPIFSSFSVGEGTDIARLCKAPATFGMRRLFDAAILYRDPK